MGTQKLGGCLGRCHPYDAAVGTVHSQGVVFTTLQALFDELGLW